MESSGSGRRKGITGRLMMRYMAQVYNLEGCYPTVSAVSLHFGISVSTAYYHLRQLEKLGRLERRPCRIDGKLTFVRPEDPSPYQVAWAWDLISRIAEDNTSCYRHTAHTILMHKHQPPSPMPINGIWDPEKDLP